MDPVWLITGPGRWRSCRVAVWRCRCCLHWGFFKPGLPEFWDHWYAAHERRPGT